MLSTGDPHILNYSSHIGRFLKETSFTSGCLVHMVKQIILRACPSARGAIQPPELPEPIIA